MRRRTTYGIECFVDGVGFPFIKLVRTAKKLRGELHKLKQLNYSRVTVYRSTLTTGFNKILHDSRQKYSVKTNG